MTNMILDYIYVFWNLQLLIKRYKQLLDVFNIIYDIVKIKKFRYKELGIFVLLIKDSSIILKTKIFVNSINKRMILI